MTSTIEASRPRMAPAKGRILAVATALFSQEGIRAVGVDRLISESSVTKATFYKHYGAKDRLVRDYLDAASEASLVTLDALVDAAPTPREALFAVADAVYATLQGEGFHGSLFVNAAAEIPSALDPARIIIAAHFDAVSARMTTLLEGISHPLPGEAADEIMTAYVGAQSWAYVGDPVGAATAFRRCIERVAGDAPHR